MNSILEVSINNILNNLEKLKYNNKTLCIPVKGNAYGFGYEIIDYLMKAGYNYFGVSTIEEALYIRKRSKTANILLFSAIFVEQLEIIENNNIEITVYDIELIKKLSPKLKFHLKIDVGMGRLGYLERDIDTVHKELKKKKLNPYGIYTHLPDANNEELSLSQIKVFEKIVNSFNEYNIKYIHYANGLAALKYKTTFDNMIRPGLITYGYFDNHLLKNKYGQEILATATLKVRCSHTKEYEGKIGYLGTEKIKGRVATIPMGYHDGLKQDYVGYMIPNVGKIVGKICMCQSMILLEDKSIIKGEYITIYKEDSVYKLSEYSKVSIYEMFSTLGNRVERIYKK